MKKFLGKSLLVAGIIGLGIFAGSTMVNAQNTFGGDAGGVNKIGVGSTTNAAGTGPTMLSVARNFVNWVLGLLSLIALGMALYGGFKMVTAAGDDTKYKEGFKILKQAAIGLIIVGFSWIIVSTVFRVIQGFDKGGPAPTQS